MNSTLSPVLTEIVSMYGVGVFDNAQRVKALFADLARDVGKPQKAAFLACLEGGFAGALKNASGNADGGGADIAVCKTELARRLHKEEGFDAALCEEAVEALAGAVLAKEKETPKHSCARCGKELQEDWKACPFCGAGRGEAAARQTAEVEAEVAFTAKAHSLGGQSAGAQSSTSSAAQSVPVKTAKENDKVKIIIAAAFIALFIAIAVNAVFYIYKPTAAVVEEPAAVVVEEPAAAVEKPVPQDFVRIPGGAFTMGSPASEPGRYDDETQHQVTVRSFYMGKYEVTQKEWRDIMGNNPSNFKGDTLPVESVSWYEVVEYCNKRSQREGLTPAYAINGQNVTWNRNANGYRLPTEAEWEYACRAGTTTPFNTGSSVDNAGWYSGNSGDKTHPVGQKQANAWGLYDMHGNVWEWCWDWYGDYPYGAQTNPSGAVSGSFRVSRGGSWSFVGQYLRSARRVRFTPSYRFIILGFRLVRNAGGGAETISDASPDAAPVIEESAAPVSASAPVAAVAVTQPATPTAAPRRNPPPATAQTPAPVVVQTTAAAVVENPVPQSFVRIPGGTFMMGSPANEPNRYDIERQHQVTVSSFYMSKYEVTQKEWRDVMGNNPSNFKGDTLPVESVSWYEVVEYCNKRSQREGLTPVYVINKSQNDPNNKAPVSGAEYDWMNDTVRWTVTWNRNANGYRLPTETEWEYACRAGTTTPYYMGSSVDSAGWYSNNSGSKTHPVGQKQANAWGLCDMHGNVGEWCWDWFEVYPDGTQTNPAGAVSGYVRVYRGGAWDDIGALLRSAHRNLFTPPYRLIILGFRLARNAG